MQLWRDRGADVVLPGELRVEFSMQKVSEGLIALQQLRSLALDVVVRADLKVPGVADKGKFEEAFEDLSWEHFLRRDHFAVSREFNAEAVPGRTAHFARYPLREVVRIAPAITLQRVANAGATCFGNVNK